MPGIILACDKVTSAMIHSLLPYKEQYTQANAGAVALNVEDGFVQSRYANTSLIFGRTLSGPYLGGARYQGLKTRHALIFGKNIGLAKGYLDFIRQHGAADLLEVHGRCQVASYLARKRPDLKIGLYLHNDPREMKGSDTPAKRHGLLQRMAVIFCVSDYLKSCFLDGVGASKAEISKIKIIPIAVDRAATTPPQKDKLITIIGRMVPEKGMLEAAQAMAKVLPKYPDWQVKFIGAKRFEDANPSQYEQKVADALAPIRHQSDMTGFISRTETKKLQSASAIVLAPSQWQEPAGRVVVEALATGAALITTRRGGIPEYAEGRAVILDQGDTDELADALERMLGDAVWRKSWQNKAWADYPFAIADMASHLDDARKAAMDYDQRSHDDKGEAS